VIAPVGVIPLGRSANWRHPDVKAIRIGRAEPFGFDPRIWKAG
jgi:hypothetical protein